MLPDLIPRASFLYPGSEPRHSWTLVATASLAPRYETINNFASLHRNPTCLILRKDLNGPPFDAWVVAPSTVSIESEKAPPILWDGVGRGYSPKHLLSAYVRHAITSTVERQLRDSIFTPELAGASSSCNSWKLC